MEEDYDLSDYEDYFKLSDIEDEDIINFAFTLDDKQMPFTSIEESIIKTLVSNNAIDHTQLFYQHHLDLFISHSTQFVPQMNDPRFLLKRFAKWQKTYQTISDYFDRLGASQSVKQPGTLARSGTVSKLSRSLTTLRRTGKSSDTLPSPPSPSSLSNLFEDIPQRSVFSQVPPTEFATVCHKLFVYYYFAMETRHLQYVSRYSDKDMPSTSFASHFKNFTNNVYRKLELEVEIFCESGSFSTLANAFMTLTTRFLALGNTVLAKICIDLIDRFKLCKQRKLTEFKASLKDMKAYNKYPYLVSTESILRGCIQIHETANKLKGFSKIFDKILNTKKQIMELEDITSDVPPHDTVVYQFLQPSKSIRVQLYTGKGDIQCLKQRCST